MKKFLLLSVMFLMVVGAFAQDKKPILLTGGTAGVTIEPLDGSTLNELYGAKFTPTDDFQNVFKIAPMDVSEEIAAGYTKIVLEFGEAVPQGWNVHAYGDQGSFVDIEGKTNYEILLEGNSIDDFTIFNWAGCRSTITVSAAYFAKEEVEVYSDLTQAMFKHWTAADATGEVEGDVNCSFVLGQSTGLPYGDGNVFYLNYADLSEYETIAVTATAGEPRLLFNRVEDQGTVNVELPRDAATYETVTDNGDGSKTYTVDIAKIVENFGFAHLHAIKGANWQNTTVTVIKLEEAAAPGPEPYELADGDYFIKNVATGKYLGGGNSWGTQASLIDDAHYFTLTKLEDGKYSFDSHTYNNADSHFLATNGYVDGAATGISVVTVDGGAAFGFTDDAFFGAPAEGTVLAADLKADDANAAWEFIPYADVLADFEAGNTTDATFLLKDASISRNYFNPSFEAAWEGDGFGKGPNHGNQNAEKWGGNSQEFDVHQTISLPNGFYKITVNGYYRYNNTTDNTNDIAIAAHADGTEVINTYLYANDAEVALKSIADDEAAAALENLPFSQSDASAAFGQGLYLNELYVEVADGQLTVGVKKIEHPGCDWSVWDNFTITKVESMPEPVDPDKPVPPTIATTELSTDGSIAQYLYNVEAKGFFLGANDWGTRASISASQGYPVKITVNEDGATYTLNDQRTDGSWHSADCQGVDQIWIDGENRAGDKMWTVAFLNNGSFTLANTYVPEGGNLSVVPSKGDTRLYLSTEDEAQDIWAAVSEEEYAKYVEAYAEYEKELEEYNKKNYKVGDDITNLAPGAWDGQTGSYGGLGRTAYERYSGAGSIEAGDVLTQTLTGLKNGTYEVSLGLAASYTSGRGFECPTGEYRAVAFANGDEEDLEVVDRTWVAGGEEETVDLIAVVTDGTLKYGIKNILKGGNWYVATVNSIKYVSEDAAVPALVDLTTDMFKHWSAADATGEAEGDLNCAYVIGESTGLPYGDGNVYYLNYADLSDCSSIVVVATEGEPRLLFNRVEDQGTVNVEVPRDAATYETVIDNEDGSKTYIVDVAKIVAEYGFAHLHAIKGANWQNTTVTSIQLEKMVTPTYITSIGYTRTAGLGYTAEEVPYNEEEIFNALGVTSWEGVEMYPVVMTDGEIGVDHDGWRNVDGDPAAWTGDGTDLGLCLKYPHDGSFALCTHPNNDPEAGTLLAAAWALKAGEKTATIRVVVEFVAPETVDIEIAENMIQASVEYDNTEASYVEKSVTLSDDDVAAILSELDLESLDDADVYGYNPTTKELVSSFTGYDGWRDANGDFANWSGDSSVPACVKYTDGQTYLCYNINGCDPQTIKTYWAIANDTKAVLVEISFTYTGAVKIADIEKAGSVKNGKFLEDGKVVIYKNGVKFNAAGVMVK